MQNANNICVDSFIVAVLLGEKLAMLNTASQAAWLLKLHSSDCPKLHFSSVARGVAALHYKPGLFRCIPPQ